MTRNAADGAVLVEQLRGVVEAGNWRHRQAASDPVHTRAPKDTKRQDHASTLARCRRKRAPGDVTTLLDPAEVKMIDDKMRAASGAEEDA
jgi:hypothetical protein